MATVFELPEDELPPLPLLPSPLSMQLAMYPGVVEMLGFVQAGQPPMPKEKEGNCCLICLEALPPLHLHAGRVARTTCCGVQLCLNPCWSTLKKSPAGSRCPMCRTPIPRTEKQVCVPDK